MEKVSYTCDSHEQAQRLRKYILAFDWNKEEREMAINHERKI